MAIAYSTSSVSDVTAAAAAILAQNAIRDALVAHPSGAWTLVEEFDTSSSEMHWTVLKNDSTLSDTGQDFYVVIGRHISDGTIGYMVAEGYTAANNTLDSYAPWPYNSGGAYKIGADFRNYVGGIVGTYALGISLPSSPDTIPFIPQVAVGETMRLVTVVEKDYAILVLNGTPVYIGAMIDSIVPMSGLDAATPIGIANLTSGDGGYFGSLTRHPADVSVINQDVRFAFGLVPVLNAATWVHQAQAGWGLYGFPDRFQANGIAASELAVLMLNAFQGIGNSNARGNLTGVHRGQFKNLRVATFPAAAGLYDSVVVDMRKAVILADRGATNGQPPFVHPYGTDGAVKWGIVADTGVAA